MVFPEGVIVAGLDTHRHRLKAASRGQVVLHDCGGGKVDHRALGGDIVAAGAQHEPAGGREPDIERIAGIVQRRRLGDAEANERDAVVPQVHLLERGHPPGGSGRGRRLRCGARDRERQDEDASPRPAAPCRTGRFNSPLFSRMSLCLCD